MDYTQTHTQSNALRYHGLNLDLIEELFYRFFFGNEITNSKYLVPIELVVECRLLIIVD